MAVKKGAVSLVGHAESWVTVVLICYADRMTKASHYLISGSSPEFVGRGVVISSETGFSGAPRVQL